MISVANDKNSHQTEGGSQILSREFISQLVLYEEGSSTQQVLNGTYNIPVGTSRYTADLLSSCQQYENIAEVQGKVDTCLRYR